MSCEKSGNSNDPVPIRVPDVAPRVLGLGLCDVPNGRSKPGTGAWVMQTTMCLLSLIMIALINPPALMEIRLNVEVAILAVLGGFAHSFP